jgi:hypothetical protein
MLGGRAVRAEHVIASRSGFRYLAPMTASPDPTTRPASELADLDWVLDGAIVAVRSEMNPMPTIMSSVVALAGAVIAMSYNRGLDRDRDGIACEKL